MYKQATIFLITATSLCAGNDEETRSKNHVLMGINYLSTGGAYYPVCEFIVHPEYDDDLVINDIGLVITNEDIEFNDRVQAIRYATNAIEVGSSVVVTGWGWVLFGGPLSDSLKEFNATIISNEECGNLFQGMCEIFNSSLCVLPPVGQGICSGDVGGPVVDEDSVVGVISFGEPCAKGYPDGLARVSYYKDWIEENIV